MAGMSETPANKRERERAFRMDTTARLDNLEARHDALLEALALRAKIGRDAGVAVESIIAPVVIAEAVRDAAEAQIAEIGAMVVHRLARAGLVIVRRPFPLI
jgi:hypothetical protein